MLLPDPGEGPELLTLRPSQVEWTEAGEVLGPNYLGIAYKPRQPFIDRPEDEANDAEEREIEEPPSVDPDPDGLKATVAFHAENFRRVNKRFAWSVTAGDIELFKESKAKTLQEVIDSALEEYDPDEPDMAIWSGGCLIAAIISDEDGEPLAVRIGSEPIATV